MRVFLLLISLLTTAGARAAGYQAELTGEARRLSLAQDRYWKLLLHDGPSLTGEHSEETRPEFFLSPKGRRDPAAELEADLAGFFEPENADADRHPQCRFPARYAWLKDKLRFDPSRLTERACPKFSAFRAAVAADSVTLVFASSYMDNPSSMYGHTFLRLDQAAHGANRHLLDYAVNYAANTDTENGILFAVYGLLGFYPGTYSAMPYYLKVQEYSNLESRDLWEYRLNLSSAAVERLDAHLYELDDAAFRYFFFNRNCSYQLLPLLETAEPSLHLSEHWPLYVIPADSLRTIAGQPGLVAERVYRPSRSTLMFRHRRRLSGDEADLAARLARGEDAWPALAALPAERRALVLDSSLDYLDYLVDYRKDRGEAAQSLKSRLLAERSKLDLPPPAEVAAEPPDPVAGHPSGRMSLGLGFGDGERYAEFSARAALHDVLDPEPGYTPYTTLEMFQLTLRYDEESKRAYLQGLDLARILSITPWDDWTRKPSWKVDAGLRTFPGLGRNRWNALGAGLGAGSGLAWETHTAGREALYVMPELDLAAGKAFNQGYRAGGGLGAGLIWHPLEPLALRFDAAYKSFFLGDKRPELSLTFASSWQLAKGLALRASLSKVRSDREAQLSLQRYF